MGVRSVSAETTLTCSGRAPSASATTPTSIAFEPWPMSIWPHETVTPPLRPNRISTNQCGLPAVGRDVLAHRMQSASVVQGCGAVAGVRAAVDEALEIQPQHAASAGPAGLHPHPHGVASAMAVADLLAVQSSLDRATG